MNYLDVTIPIKPSKDKFEKFRLNLESYCNKLAPKLNLNRKQQALIYLENLQFLKILFYLNSIINYLCCSIIDYPYLYFSASVVHFGNWSISEPLIQSVLNSNLCIYNRRICSLVPFRFL